jgi:L-rhamnose mutarotase
MSHPNSNPAHNTFVCAVAATIGLILAGCEQQPLGKRIAQRLPQVDATSSGPALSADPASPGGTVTQDAASWKRYCSLYLLSAAGEVAKDATATEDNQKPPATSAASRLPGFVHKYKSLFDEIPPEVVKAMSLYNVRNYSVHIGRAGNDYYAVRYFEYAGSDPEVDLTLLARNPAYYQWEEACKAYQKDLLPTSGRSFGPFMEEVFYRELRSE